jgi:hypothetical protein
LQFCRAISLEFVDLFSKFSLFKSFLSLSGGGVHQQSQTITITRGGLKIRPKMVPSAAALACLATTAAALQPTASTPRVIRVHRTGSPHAHAMQPFSDHPSTLQGHSQLQHDGGLVRTDAHAHADDELGWSEQYECDQYAQHDNAPSTPSSGTFAYDSFGGYSQDDYAAGFAPDGAYGFGTRPPSPSEYAGMYHIDHYGHEYGHTLSSHQGHNQAHASDGATFQYDHGLVQSFEVEAGNFPAASGKRDQPDNEDMRDGLELVRVRASARSPKALSSTDQRKEARTIERVYNRRVGLMQGFGESDTSTDEYVPFGACNDIGTGYGT